MTRFNEKMNGEHNKLLERYNELKKENLLLKNKNNKIVETI